MHCIDRRTLESRSAACPFSSKAMTTTAAPYRFTRVAWLRERARACVHVRACVCEYVRADVCMCMSMSVCVCKHVCA